MSEERMPCAVEMMQKVESSKLPAFYTDARGAYGVVIGTVYICCFVNQDDWKYNVTVDGISAEGCFDLNFEWEGYDTAEDAVKCLRRMVKKYGR